MSYNLLKNAEINSKEYWDHRFETDWKERGGIEQSTFFSKIAVENIPSWLKAEIQSKGYHICDWGCAFGDGTYYLKNQLNTEKVTGVDFSDSAIEYAKRAYPDVNFIAADFTKKLPSTRYDILFTSNTLEHFEDPWLILNKISSVATAHVIVMVPFKEYEKFEEHFYTFDFNNIPITLSNDFVLTHSSVANTGLLEKSYWPGKQVLLIFSSLQLLKNESRTLADISLESILYQKDLVAQLNREMVYQLQEIRRLSDNNNDWQKTVSQKDVSINELQKVLGEKDALIGKYETKQEGEIKTLYDKVKELEEELKKHGTEASARAEALQKENAILDENQKQQIFINEQLQKEIIALLSQLSYSRELENLAIKNASRAENSVAVVQKQANTTSVENEMLSNALNKVKSDLYSIRNQHHSISSAYAEILNSRSWKFTQAIRRPVRYFKKMAISLKTEGVKKTLRKILPVGEPGNARPGTKIEPILTQDILSIPPEPIRRDHDKKRICLLVKEFNSGGLERVVFDLALRLSEKNYTTSILVANLGGKIEMEARKAGIEVYMIYEDPEKLQSFIKNWQPDILFTNHCYFGLETFAQSGVSIIEIIHNAYFWQQNNHYCREIREKYIGHFIAVSQFVRQYSVEHLYIPESDISIINNGLNLDGFIRPPRYLRDIISDQTTEQQFTFILSANFRPSKCHYTAVEALKIVHQKFPWVKLQFAGGVDDENLYQLLRNKVVTDGLEGHVEFLGLLNRRQLSHVMAKANGAILPSSYEGFSITTLEYMFFGLPMILTDVGAARDVIYDNDIGLILSPPIVLDKMNNEKIAEVGIHPEKESVQKLADAMTDFIANRKLWKQKGNVAAEKVNQYMIDTVVDKYVTTIEKTLSTT